MLLHRRSSVYPILNRGTGWPAGRVKFVFTTHATTIGRHLSAGGADLTGIFRAGLGYDYAGSQANDRGIALEHRIECAAAHACDILTTVSHVTNLECEHFLGRKAEVVTWNGLDVDAQKGLVDDHEL